MFLRAPLRFKVGVDAPETSDSSPNDRGLALLRSALGVSMRSSFGVERFLRALDLCRLSSTELSWLLAGFAFRSDNGSGASVGSLKGSDVVASHPSIRPPKTFGTIGETVGVDLGSGLGEARLRVSGVLVLFGSRRLALSSDGSDVLEVFSRGPVAGLRLISFAAGVLGVVMSVEWLF